MIYKQKRAYSTIKIEGKRAGNGLGIAKDFHEALRKRVKK